jgi:TP901 family phage tail tape measure protein
MNDTVKMVLKLIDEASQPLRNAIAEVNNLDSVTKRVSGAGLNVLKGAIAGVVTTASLLIATLGGLGAASLNIGGNFEAQMNIVGVSVNGAQENFEALKQTALDLGSSTNFSAIEAAQGIETLGKNGLDAKQILDGALESTLNLAGATGTDLANAADIATGVMLNFNKEATDLPGIIDLIVGSIGESKFSIDDFSYAMANAGGVAGATGVPFDEFATTIAAISNSFSSGQDAGTSFKSFLVSLPGSSDEAKAAIKDLGLSFFDSEGAMRPMAEIAEQLQNAFAGLTEEQKLQASQTIFGTDAMRAALAMAEQGGEGFQALDDKIRNADAAEQAAARMQGLKGAIENLQGTWQTLMIALYDSGLGEFATDVLGQLNESLREVVNNKPFIEGLGNTLKTIFTAVGEVVSWVGARIGEFFTSLNQYYDENSSVVSSGWVKNVLDGWEFVRAGVADVVDFVQTTFTTLSSLYTENETTVNAWMGNISGYWQTFLSAVDTVIILAVGLWQNILKPAWGEIEPFVVSFLEAVKNNWAQAKDNLASVFDFLVALWQNVLYPVWNAIAPFVKGVWDAVLIAVQTAWNLIEPIFNSIAALLKGDFSAAWESAKEAARIAWEGLRDIVLSIGEGLVTSLQTIGTNMIQGLIDGFTGMMSSLKEKVEGVGSSVIGWFKEVLGIQSPSTVFAELGSFILEGLINGFTNMLTTLKDKVQNVGSSVIGWFKDVLGIQSPSTVFMEAGESTGEGFIIGLQNMAPKIKEVIDTLFPGLSGINFGGALGYGAGGNTGGASEDSGSSEIDVVKKQFLDLGEKVLPGLGNAIAGFQAGPVAGMIAIFTTLLSRSETFQKLMEQVNLVLEPVIEAVGGLLDALWPAIDAILKMVTVGLKPVIWILSNIVAPVFTFVAKIVAGIWNAFATAINWALGWLGVRLDTIDLNDQGGIPDVNDPTKEIPKPEPLPDVPKPPTSPNNPVTETRRQAEIQFGNIPQAVQFAVATPLMEAANTMLIAATLMRETFSGGVATSPEVFTTASITSLDATFTRADAMYTRVENFYNKLMQNGIMLKTEHTIKSNKSSFVSKTAVAR